MSQIRFETHGDKTDVYTPYDPEFVRRLKSTLGTREFDRSKKCWTVNTDDLNVVKNIILDIYGYEGSDNDLVKVKITFTDIAIAHRDAFRISGIEIARAFNRDSGAKLGQGVSLLEGEVDSGGSKANWTTVIEEGTVLTATLPRVVAEKKDVVDNRGFVVGTMEIIESVKVDRSKLEEEKAKLLARVAEIDKLLAE